MSDDIIAIQTQLSFHEDSLHELNEVITRQQRELDDLRKIVYLLKENIEEINKIQDERNTPPPHY